MNNKPTPTPTSTIRERIINYYRTAECDRYGQLPTISVRAIAKTEEEVEELKRFVNVSTYGSRFGNYQGFRPWTDFQEAYLKSECATAFHNNPSRKNQNNW